MYDTLESRSFDIGTGFSFSQSSLACLLETGTEEHLKVPTEQVLTNPRRSIEHVRQVRNGGACPAERSEAPASGDNVYKEEALTSRLTPPSNSQN